MIEYLDKLLNQSSKNRPLYRFDLFKIYSNLGVSPLKNLTQLCPVVSRNVLCLDSNNLDIYCGSDDLGKTIWANITFKTWQQQEFSFFVNFSSFPPYLDAISKKNTIMIHNTTRKWIELVWDGLSSVFVIDYLANFTLFFENKFSLTIYAPSIIAKNSSGLLINGCVSKTSINIG